MLTRWLTFTAFLAGSANPQRAATGPGTLTVAPTCRVRGHPEVALTLICGDGKNTGVVPHWHTPFGDLQTPGFHSNLDPVFMHRDGSLAVPNSSGLHSGLYYCLLQDPEGTTLWPYELHIGYNNEKDREHSEHERGSSCGAFRFRREVWPEQGKQAAVSDGQFAGAVAASVLLTFVLGFSAGALSRAHVLRCLGAVFSRVQSPRRQRSQADTPDHGSEVAMATLPPVYNNQAFEMGQVWDNVTMETTISSTSSSPPAKPQRSFRHKRQELQETTAYLERYEDKYSEDGEEEDGREGREEKRKWRQEEEEAGQQENRSREDGEQTRGSEEEAGSNEEKGSDEKREEEEVISRDSQESSTETEEEETGSKKGGIIGGGGGEASHPPPCPGRRSRIIRLYQYDEDGQRYCHLPDPPDDPAPPHRLKHRSASLTRLNAIMAAASAGPLDTRKTEGERDNRPHFHMDI
ncbi:uncharacterized protein LOC121187209 [Toxotes jaculatrix]|uniref:uncharacterized protein LOC121187209 n=1 Tax=Toxotes jaculatrix TaxID=941984 RepID=UPI001B3AEE84|nr:uncharacterized protein LOC121187209 [Toxotes jaculatrix]